MVYIVGVILSELFPNILTTLIIIGSFFGCIGGLILFLIQKDKPKKHLIFVPLLLLPFIDIGFGITTLIKNKVKGSIVLDVIDDSFASTNSLTIRIKNGKLHSEYYSSVAGIGSNEKAVATILNDSTIAFKILERKYSDTLIYDSKQKYFKTGLIEF